MYAVIETGGKQYRVEVGMELEVELLDGNPGDALNLERVLLVADGETAAIGRPIVENASVAAEIVRRDRGVKTISFKYRPKARSRVKKGHRQELTVLRISDIVLDGKSAAAEKAEVDKARQAERQRLEETARKQAAADAALAAKLAADKKAAAADEAKAAKPTARKSASEAKTTTEAKATTEAKTTTKAKTATRGRASTSAKAAPKSSETKTTKTTKPTAAKADAQKPAGRARRGTQKDT